MVEEYCFDCTGDACVGDAVRFERDIFAGSWRNAKFVRREVVEGVIVADSYGALKQQHTFTIRLTDGSKLRIKGRNLYKHTCQRKAWADESLRVAACNEKHIRGNAARQARARRREGSTY